MSGFTDERPRRRAGLSWRHTGGSALIGWIKDDAEYLAQKIGELEPAAGADAAVPAAGG